MGFRQGAYATVWEVKPATDVRTNARITISKKDQKSGGYIQEFSGYVSFLGTEAANKALKLNPKDRIRLGNVDVSNKYDKEKKITYTNCNIFSFDGPDELESSNKQSQSGDPQPQVDDGEINDERLPF